MLILLLILFLKVSIKLFKILHMKVPFSGMKEMGEERRTWILNKKEKIKMRRILHKKGEYGEEECKDLKMRHGKGPVTEIMEKSRRRFRFHGRKREVS